MWCESWVKTAYFYFLTILLACVIMMNTKLLVTSNRNSFLKNHWFEELGKTKIVQRYYFDKWSQIKHWQHWVNIEINVKYSYQYSSTIKESIVLYYSLILLRVISVWFCQKFSTNIRISKLAKVYYFSFFSLHVWN